MTGGKPTEKQPRQMSMRVLVIVTTVVFLVVAAAATFFAIQFFALKSNSDAADEATVQRLVSEVSDIYIVPSGDPKVVMVKDKTPLDGQEFFAKAENGDYILIYPDDKLAILYREKDKKIVNVAPIALNDGQQDGTAPVPDDKPAE